MYRVSKSGRKMAMGWLAAVELIVTLIDEVSLGTIPKPACPWQNQRVPGRSLPGHPKVKEHQREMT